LKKLTYDEDSDTIFAHTEYGRIFSINLQTYEEKFLFRYGSTSNLFPIGNFWNPKTKKWNIIERYGENTYFVVDISGKFDKTEKLMENLGSCAPTAQFFSFDKSTGLYYYTCGFSQNPTIRMLKVKENLEESTYEDIRPRFNISNFPSQFVFAENGVLYVYLRDFGGLGSLKGFDIASGKEVYVSRVPFEPNGRFYCYYVPVASNSAINPVKLVNLSK
jgi:hypothetical protein